MKIISLTVEAANLLNALCNHALKGVGLEAYNVVKQVEAWLQTAADPVTSTKTEEK